MPALNPIASRVWSDLLDSRIAVELANVLRLQATRRHRSDTAPNLLCRFHHQSGQVTTRDSDPDRYHSIKYMWQWFPRRRQAA